jgi:hypothetical protein
MSVALSTPAVDTFEHIIRQQSTQELLPFLLNLPKADVVAVRKKTRSLDRELDQFVELGGGRWGTRGSAEQHWMLFLAGLRTFTRKEALSGRFGNRWNDLAERPTFWTLVEHVRPDWLGDWLQRWASSSGWGMPAYRLLRELEDRQLIAYQPALFAAAVPGLLHEFSRRYQPLPVVPANLAELVQQELQADATLLTRDLPLVFDFDTSVDSAQVWAQDERPTRNGLFKGNWQEWSEQHPPQIVTWADLLPRLVASGHLDRADLLTRCLLALRRDFRRPLLTWFKALYLGLQPGAAEQLARQSELVELLAHPLPLVVNFALDQLKAIWLERGFDAAPLLLYAEGLMTRADLKTSLRSLLGGLEKLLRQQPALAPTLASLATAALPNADAGVQERAAKLLAGLLGAKKPLLTTDEAADAVAGISAYADLLGAAARSLLSPFLAAPVADAPDIAEADYAPRTEFVPELSAATALAPVQDWHELLFLTGQVLQHDDPAALERWVDGLLRLRPQFPLDYAAPLQPYLLQIMPYWKGRSEAERAAILRQPPTDGHLGLVHALLLGWAGGFAAPLLAKVNTRGHQYSTSDPLVEVERQRLLVAESRLAASLPLPLLSTPTHAPAWLAPSVLVQRLLAHEAAQQQPDPADLAVALARTAHAHPAEAAAARALLPQLQHAALRQLLEWLLAPAEQPVPALSLSRKSVLQQLKGRLSQLIPRRTEPATLEEALPWLWAVAARTRQPTGQFAALTALSDYEGVAAPWQPQWAVRAKSRTYVEQWRPGKPTRTDHWVELELPVAPVGGGVPSTLLLYSQHARFAKPEHARWHLDADLPFLASLLPNYPTPLYWHVLRGAGLRSDISDAEAANLIGRTLRTLLGAGPAFDEAATLLLAAGLTSSGAECRALALEVLLAAVETGRLDAAALGRALGVMLAAELVPVHRLADNLAQARAISPRTDDALRQVLEGLLPLLPAEPLRNTRKLLEAYADLLGRRRQPVPEAVQARLRAWGHAPALKKAALGLLA